MFGVSKKDILLILLLNVVWGSAFAIGGYGLKYFSELFLYSMRFLIVGILTAPFFRLKEQKNMFKIAFMGLCQAFTFYGVALAVKNLDSSISAIVTRLDIIFTIIFGIIFFKEKLKPQLIVGLILCVLAVFVLSGDIHFTNSKYLYLLIFASIASGFLNIISKTIKTESSLAIVSWNSYWTGIFLFLVALGNGQTFIIKPIDIKAIGVVFYMSIFSSYFAYLILYYVLRKNDTTKIMPYNFIRPVVAIFAGLIVLNESITAVKIYGIILITLGVFVSQYEKKEIQQN
jgi:drug/metabolite transporter (DMT)-like permease